MITLAHKSITDSRFLSDRVEYVYGYGYRPHSGNDSMLDMILSVKNKAGNYADIVIGYCNIEDKETAMDTLHSIAFPN